ncbi:MAG: peptidylprolyl isomerase [Phycisphaerales bacterium]
MNRLFSLLVALALGGAAAAVALSDDPPKDAPPAVAPAKPADAPAEPRRAPTAKERAKGIKEIRGAIETVGGTIGFQLEPNKCPLLCANFCNLVRKGYFDGRPWFEFSRVVRQAGSKGIAYTVPREFDPSLFFDRGGRIAMAKDRDASEGAFANGARFFITVKNQERWNLDYPVFGNVTSGIDVLVALNEGDKITKITVEGDVDNLLKTFETEVAKWDKAFEAAKKTGLLD